MLRKFLLAALLITLLVSTSLAQETPGPRIEITGVNPAALPRVSVMVNAFDSFGQPLPDLTPDSFRVVGPLAEHARVVDVVSFSDPQSVPISVVLAIDVSTSMAGSPVRKAREAAAAFVNTMADDDPVAILTFSSSIDLVQGFTTDRDTLMSVIDGLAWGGQTLLYDASLQAITLAASLENPRRAVILLGDGAHFDEHDRSAVTREEAHRAAVIEGVPVYTIGLGFGADRSYLERLAGVTNAFFTESPTPQELNEIYTGLADLLRTQYDVTLDVDVPLDGRIWQLELEVDTPLGTVRDSGRLRAPVPVPVFSFPTLPAPIREPMELEADIVADDGIAAVTVALDDAQPVPLTGPPFTWYIDPVTLSPGVHSLQFSATDNDGDSGSATLEFDIAALPPEVSIEPDPAGEIDEAQTFTLTVGGQTALATASWRVDGGASRPLGPDLEFTIDPNTLSPGEHTLQLEVTNTGGETSSPAYAFTVPPLPVQFVIEGLQEGALLEDSADLGVTVQSSQLPVTDVSYTLNDVPLADQDDRITLQAAELEPGAATLEVSVHSAGGQADTASLQFEVARLPLEIDLEGVRPGTIVESDLDLTINVSGQGSGFQVEALIDGAPILLQEGSAQVAILDLTPGEHTLVILARDEVGNVTEASYTFSVSPGPAQTATRTVEDRRATETAQAATATEVQRALVAATAAAQQQQTATQASANRRSTSVARSADLASRNRARVTATRAARATATQVAGEQMATTVAEAAAVARATGTQVAVERRATAASRSTAIVQRNRERVTATSAARATVTQVAMEEIATSAARATSTQIVVERRATATSVAGATATRVATQRIATATSVAQATETRVAAQRNATATSAAGATATQVATQQIAIATRAAEATSTQVATQRIATATQAARTTATSAARATATQNSAQRNATLDAVVRAAEQLNRQVRATATQVATRRIATATQAAEATATQVATQRIATATRAAEATATRAAEATATQAAEATATQVATQRIATATQAAEATATQVATQRIATATQAAEATATQVATQRIATATQAAEATATQVATRQIATATSAAQSTATQVMVERNATAAARATVHAERNRERIAATRAARQEASATQAAAGRSATLDAIVIAAELLNRQVQAAATENVRATESVLRQTATAVMRATQSALASQTAAAQATADARATNSALAATEAVAMATVDAQQTQEVLEATQRALALRSERATATAQADIDATATARAANLLVALATESALATEAAAVTPTPTATPVPTEPEPSDTPTTEAPVASITPVGTLVPAQAETTPAEGLITPVVVLCAALGLIGLLGLLLIFSLLRGARRGR